MKEGAKDEKGERGREREGDRGSVRGVGGSERSSKEVIQRQQVYTPELSAVATKRKGPTHCKQGRNV